MPRDTSVSVSVFANEVYVNSFPHAERPFVSISASQGNVDITLFLPSSAEARRVGEALIAASTAIPDTPQPPARVEAEPGPEGAPL